MPPIPSTAVENNGVATRQMGRLNIRNNGSSQQTNISMDVIDTPPSVYEYWHPNGPLLNFCRESDRLKSFERWPVEFLTPNQMAKAGFYFTKSGDVVKCAFCKVEIGQWASGDDPMADHLRWAPTCRFVRKQPVGNVPLGQVSPSASHRSADSDISMRNLPRIQQNNSGYDTCGPYGIEMRSISPSSSSSGSNNNSELSETTNNRDLSDDDVANNSEQFLKKIGGHKYRAPSFPEYVTVEQRLKTYESWPISMKLRPDALTEAGFFYTGKGDQTICFHCGGGLKDWEENDEPWEEHARWFPKCSYVIHMKDQEYIDKIRKRTSLIDTTTGINSGADLKESTSREEQSEVVSVNICKICFQEEVRILFYPCRHAVACVKCGLSLTKCPICQKTNEGACTIYLS